MNTTYCKQHHAYCSHNAEQYTQDELDVAVANARRAALLEAAVIADNLHYPGVACGGNESERSIWADGWDCSGAATAEAIRALIDQAPSTKEGTSV